MQARLISASGARGVLRGQLVPAKRLMATKAAEGAYVDAGLSIEPAGTGPLDGLTFAAKDMYDIAGHVTGFGSPTWRETHEAASATAPAVQALLNAGARLRGRTHMDELAYSLNGENAHYGTPVNPAAPDRVPGGSSSGSAAAVAAGDVEFALGSDTGGSIRVPASYCGIFGMRPSHGRVSLEGASPLAPSLDTGGWFARDLATLTRVGGTLLKEQPQPVTFRRLLIGTDAFDLCMGEVQKAMLEAILARRVECEQAIGPLSDTSITDPSQGLGGLRDWFQVFRIIQAAEAWRAHGDWISEAKPSFGPGVKDRFEAAARISKQEEAESIEKRSQIVSRLTAVLGDDAILLVPAAPGPAPKLKTPSEELESFRSRLLALTCVAGLGGLPQISVPFLKIDGCPVGLGLIGPKDTDEALLTAAEALSRALES